MGKSRLIYQINRELSHLNKPVFDLYSLLYDENSEYMNTIELLFDSFIHKISKLH